MSVKHALTIEIVYLTATAQSSITLNLPENSSVLDAINTSNILTKHPEINLEENKVGIFGKIVSMDTMLKHGDRIEIYRPLQLDPKQKRFLKVARCHPEECFPACAGKRFATKEILPPASQGSG